MQESIASVLKDRRLFLEKTIIKAGKALKDVPEGRVRCKKKKGRPEYYWVTKPGDTAGRYLSVKETDLVKALAQKAYNSDVLKIAKEELKRVVALEKYRTEWFFRRKNTVIPAKRKPRVRSMETVSPVTRKPLQK